MTDSNIHITDRSNKFGGRCADTQVFVPKERGWLGVQKLESGRFKWVVLSDVAKSNRIDNGEVPKRVSEIGGNVVNFMQRRQPRIGRRSRQEGKTSGVSITETWYQALIDNERIAREGSQRPLTDAEISAYMKSEFPKSPDKATNESTVKRRRKQFNERTSAFARLPHSEHQSREYDQFGNVVLAGGGRSTRTSKPAEEQVVAPAAVDMKAVEEMIDGKVKEGLKKNTPPVIKIEWSPRRTTTINTEGKHKQFDKIIKKVAAGLPILLVGPTGSGKSFIAKQVADELKLPYTFNSMSEGVSESSLLGRVMPDSKGKWSYQDSPFVKSFRDGGVHLLDEIDASDPNLLVQINGAIANRMLSLPFADVKPIPQHKNNVLIAAANTFGKGADRQYVGRNQLDESTLDRFKLSTVEIDYDREVEQQIAESIIDDGAKALELLTWAWSIRDKIESSKMRRVMSTRNIEDASKLLRAGEDLKDIKETYFLGWNEDEKAKISISGAAFAPRTRF